MVGLLLSNPIASRRVLNLKKTTRLPILLLIAVLSMISLASAQEFATSVSSPLASTYPTGGLLHKYLQMSALPTPDRRNFFSSSSAAEKSNLWRVHLALQLVKRPEFNEGQVRIILEAISFASAEFFASSREKTKADDGLQLLTRHALGAFSKNEAADLFANIGGRTEDDILKKYSDISALPLKIRKALFRNASSVDKTDLWRTHLALFLVKRPDLNAWQREIILEAMSFATPECFDVRSKKPALKAKMDEQLRSLEHRILVAFSFEDGAKIFAMLGDEDGNRSPNQSESALLAGITYKQFTNDSRQHKQWNHSRSGIQDIPVDRGGSCECSTNSDWCAIGSYCAGTTCSPTQNGCGTFWSYPCNGASCQ